MKVQKIFQIACLMVFMIFLCLADVFAATRADELFQKAISEMHQDKMDSNSVKLLLNTILACDDANDVLRIRIHQLRARFNFSNTELAKSDCNSAILIAKGLIDQRISGNTNLSQDYLIWMCDEYGAAASLGSSVLSQAGEFNEAADMFLSYSGDILKLGPFVDVNGQEKILDFTVRGWCRAAKVMKDAKKPAEAHKIFENAIEVLNRLDCLTPEMREKDVYTMQLGALITSDVNDESFGAAVAEIIEKNKTKPWIVDSSITIASLTSFEKRFIFYTKLINAQPTNADAHSMASLYDSASRAAKLAGHPEEAVIYYKTLKQKYPNDPLSNLPN